MGNCQNKNLTLLRVAIDDDTSKSWEPVLRLQACVFLVLEILDYECALFEPIAYVVFPMDLVIVIAREVDSQFNRIVRTSAPCTAFHNRPFLQQSRLAAGCWVKSIPLCVDPARGCAWSPTQSRAYSLPCTPMPMSPGPVCTTRTGLICPS